jgi:hypothetical protein
MDCHILCRNCLLKRVIEGKIEGKIEVTGRRGRRRKQLLDDLRKTKVILRCVIPVVCRINQTIYKINAYIVKIQLYIRWYAIYYM